MAVTSGSRRVVVVGGEFAGLFVALGPGSVPVQATKLARS